MTDAALIDALVQAASSSIEAAVNGSLQAGRSIGEIVIVVERQMTGLARVTCGSRVEALRSLRADARLTPNVCHHIEEAMNAAKVNELPIVLVAQEQDAVVAGIRLVAGGFIGVA
jgi:hypothetical protein